MWFNIGGKFVRFSPRGVCNALDQTINQMTFLMVTSFNIDRTFSH